MKRVESVIHRETSGRNIHQLKDPKANTRSATPTSCHSNVQSLDVPAPRGCATSKSKRLSLSAERISQAPKMPKKHRKDTHQSNNPEAKTPSRSAVPISRSDVRSPSVPVPRGRATSKSKPPLPSTEHISRVPKTPKDRRKGTYQPKSPEAPISRSDTQSPPSVPMPTGCAVSKSTPPSPSAEHISRALKTQQLPTNKEMSPFRTLLVCS